MKSPAKKPVTPFVAQQVQTAQNQQAAALLFTPHVVPRPSFDFSVPRALLGPSRLRQVSPSPLAHRSASPLAPDDSSDSDSVEEELGDGLKKINLTAAVRPSPKSKSPRAGPHSKQRGTAAKPKGGARDIWAFFEKSDGRHNCILCKYVLCHIQFEDYSNLFVDKFIALILLIRFRVLV